MVTGVPAHNMFVSSSKVFPTHTVSRHVTNCWRRGGHEQSREVPEIQVKKFPTMEIIK